jgi:hypothetical protein
MKKRGILVFILQRPFIERKTFFTRKVNVMLFLPAVSLLSACGGGADADSMSSVQRVSVSQEATRPENYVPADSTLAGTNEDFASSADSTTRPQLKQNNGNVAVTNAETAFSSVTPSDSSSADRPYSLLASVASVPTTTASSTGTSWTFCATEGSVCSFSGTSEVRYGTSSAYVTKTATGSVACNNATFGDPAPGVVKSCSYSNSTDSTAPAAPTQPVTSLRNPLKQPFASNSIWNMPIGSNAVYVPANLSPNPGNNIYAKMPGIDDEKIILKPTAPLVKINQSSAGWSGKDRCVATGGLLLQVPMPTSYVVPNTNKNSSATFLLGDGRTIVQTQPLARCTTGGSGTAMVKFANVDLYGVGITGAHGGSGLSAIGGSIRLGELRPGSATGPRHALKVNVYAKEALFKCTTRASCHRWPAVTSDSYAVGWYGTAKGNLNTAMKMGALLAIAPSISVASLGLETAPAKQLAWTLQNYGGYIVDDTYAAGFDFNVEDGPDGSKKAEFKADWGFDMEQKVQGNTPWMRDIQRIAKALSVVNNNGPTTIGGGGTPRQPLAAPIAP